MDDLPSLNLLAPLTISSPNPPLFHDGNSQSHERFIEQKDSPQSTLEEDEDSPQSTLIMKRSCLMPRKMDSCGEVDITERLRRFITGEMYGLDLKLVIRKSLYESDLSTNQNRLNMPIRQLKTQPDEFLTADENRMMDENKDGIEVRVVGPMFQMYEKPLWLKKWHMRRNDDYVLKKNWNNFMADHKQVLKKNTMIQVWSFRKDRQLCFAIVPVEKPDFENTMLHDHALTCPMMYFNFLV